MPLIGALATGAFSFASGRPHGRDDRALLPLVPSFGCPALLYVAHSIVNRGSIGARQALGASLVRDRRHGLAGSLKPSRGTCPQRWDLAVSGNLISLGALFRPFLCAADLQLRYVALFPAMIGRYERPQSRGAD